MKKITIIFYLCCMFVCLALRAQQISISPSLIYSGGSTVLKITGNTVAFTANTDSCPDKLHVSISNVVLDQASSTLSLSDLTIENKHLIQATVVLPDQSNIFSVVVGKGSNCEIRCNSCVQVIKPYFIVSPGFSESGTTAVLTLAGNFKFKQQSPTICPAEIQVGTNSVYLKNGNDFLYPDSIFTNDSGILQAVFNIPSSTPPELWDVYANSKDQNCQQVCQECFQTTSPKSISVKSDTGSTGDNLDVVISGNGIQFVQGSSTCIDGKFDPAVVGTFLRKDGELLSAKKYAIQSTSEVKASFFLPFGLPGGSYDLVMGQLFGCPVVCSGCVYIDSTSIPAPRALNVIAGAYRNGLRNFKVFSSDLQFDDDSTICPDKQKIVQGELRIYSDTGYFEPVAIQLADTLGKKYITGTTRNIPGTYDLVTGVHSGCPALCSQCLTIDPVIVVPKIIRTITQVSPDTVWIGETLNVRVSGYNLSFSSGTPTISMDENFMSLNKDSISIHPNYSYNYGNYIDGNFFVPADVPDGHYDITLNYADTTLICSNCIYVAFRRVITGYGSGFAGSGTWVQYTSKNIQFDTIGLSHCPGLLDLPSSSFTIKKDSTNIQADSLVYLSGSTFMAHLNIPYLAKGGSYDVVLTADSGCSYDCKGCFVVECNNKGYIEISGPGFICLPEDTLSTYFAHGAKGGIGNWATSDAEIVSQTDTIIRLRWNNGINYGTLSYNWQSECGNVTSFLQIEISDKRNQNTVFGNFHPCPFTTQCYSVNASGNYQWHVEGGEIINDTSLLFVKWSNQKGLIWVTDSNQCGYTESNRFVVSPDSQQVGGSVVNHTNYLQASEYSGVQWYKNGNAIPGDTNYILLLTQPVNTSINSYFFTAKNECGYLVSDTIVITEIVEGAINSISENRLVNVYPNPANDIVYVNPETPTSENMHIDLLDGLGQILKTFSVGNGILNVQDVPAGMYTLRISGSSKQFYQKLMVSH